MIFSCFTAAAGVRGLLSIFFFSLISVKGSTFERQDNEVQKTLELAAGHRQTSTSSARLSEREAEENAAFNENGSAELKISSFSVDPKCFH